MIPLTKDVAALVGEFADDVDNRSLLYEKFAFPKVWVQAEKVDEAARWNVLRIVNRGSELLKDDATRLRRQSLGKNVRPDKAERFQRGAQLAEKLSKIAVPDAALSKAAADNARQLLTALEQAYAGRVITFSGVLGGRLLVNMAGGVVENAGICLDRCFGLPYLPASAVKGVARCQALWEIRQSPPDKKATLLKRATLLFGFGRQQLTGEGPIVWAGGQDIAREIAGALGTRELKGVASFLPAYPTKPPKLVVDIVNPHYREYYAGKRRQALDDENPVPNYFPAVETGAEFGFAVLLNREPDALGIDSDTLLKQARGWLESAIKEKGIGAKTAAGYGWFNLDPRQSDRPTREDHQPQPSQVAGPSTSSLHQEVIAKWRGQLHTTANFAVALPEIAAVEDVESLRSVFEAVIPENERRRMRKNHPYWQSFTSGRHGVVGKIILERLGLKLT